VQLYCKKCHNSTPSSTEMGSGSAGNPIEIDSGSEASFGPDCGHEVTGWSSSDAESDAPVINKDGSYVVDGQLYDPSEELPAVDLTGSGGLARAEVRKAGNAVDCDRVNCDGLGREEVAGPAVDADPAASDGLSRGEAAGACWCGASLGPDDEECDDAVQDQVRDLYPGLCAQDIHEMASEAFCPDCLNPDPADVLVCDVCGEGYLCLNCCPPEEMPSAGDLWHCSPDCEDETLQEILERARGPGSEVPRSVQKFFCAEAEATPWGNKQHPHRRDDLSQDSNSSGSDGEMWEGEADFIVRDLPSGARCLVAGLSPLEWGFAQARALQAEALQAEALGAEAPRRAGKRRRRARPAKRRRPAKWSSSEESSAESSDGEAAYPRCKARRLR
jgi:hypothetical protein